MTLQVLHFSVNIEDPLHHYGVFIIQLNVSELGDCQVFCCCRSFLSDGRSDCIMKFNTSPTFTPPNTQPIDF